MELVIISPKGILCNATVESVSVPGTAGRFMVLQNHAPLVSTLDAGEVRYNEDGEVKELLVKGGFVRVCNNRIEISVETDGSNH